jgi:DNA (cytosine-5)-methyltransferase 1
VNGDAPRLDDPRAKTLERYIKVVEELLPRVLLIENVRGLNYTGKDEGLLFLRSALADINARCHTSYEPTVMHLNAADYGVPQLRERVFIVASRNGTPFVPPPTTHSLRGAAGTQRYCTTWDSIGDLDLIATDDDARPTGKWADLLPSIPEGENYLFHTPRGGGRPLFGWRTRYWSFLLKLDPERPSPTIQARPGPNVGPFHWENRRLRVPELRRLFTFPDSFEFVGRRMSIQSQIGNSVPPLLARQVVESVSAST